jgi:arginyl-tRNA synthetase
VAESEKAFEVIYHRLAVLLDEGDFDGESRQALHFRMVFDTARRAGWLPETVQVEHVPFGTVLGTDGRPFKTRSGKTVRLADLLDDAEAAVRTVLEAKEHDFADAELDAVVHGAGIAAIKYADLSNTRTKDYVFDMEQMVATTGNTGVYLQYAHARIRSILRKATGQAEAASAVGRVDATLPLHATEKALALNLDGFEATLRDVADTLEPHRLCGYLYDVATSFTRFYDALPRAQGCRPRRSRQPPRPVRPHRPHPRYRP